MNDTTHLQVSESLRITDEAVAKAVDAYWTASGNRAVSMRAALEAAVPLLAPQPVVDRETLFNVMDAALPVHVHADDRDRAIDAVLALINGSAS